MKRSHKINYVLEQLYEIDNVLGGSEKNNIQKKKFQEFEFIRDNTNIHIQSIEILQQQRDTRKKRLGDDSETIKLSSKIRDKFSEIDSELIQLQQTLVRYIKKPKKFSVEIIQNFQTQLIILKDALRLIKIKEYGDVPQELNECLVQFKDLISQPQKESLMRFDLTQQEKDALERWNRNDQIMDKELDIIVDNADRIKDKALLIGDVKIQYTQAQIKEMQKQVDKTNNQLKTSNQMLKELVKKYRRPNKFCLDVTLCLVLLGLIAVCVNMIKNGI